MQITLPNEWKPRHYQMDAWRYLEGGGRHCELVWHRRSGKDDLGLHWTAVASFERVGTYWYMLPLAAQAKKAIWNAINPKTGKKRIDEAFPPELRKRKNDQEMYIELISGSTFQVVGSDNFNSLVGSPPIGLVYSEWALSNPAAKAYLRPILAENNGWQIFNTTPRGKNHAYRTLQAAKDDPAAFAQVLTAVDTGVLSAEQLARLLTDYIKDYGEALGTAYFEQEFMCSFETPVMGAIYAKELREAATRIMRVPYDPSKPVHIFWDLGRADKTAIWFAQLGPFEYRVIDYLEGVGKHIGEYIVDLQTKQYVYGDCWLPHDANNELLAAERTVAQQLRNAGFKTRTVPKTSVDTRIEAARLMLPMTYFDEQKSETGLDALRNYRYSVDEDTKQFSKEPLHDWASHAADAFGYMAVALKEPKRRESVPQKRTGTYAHRPSGGYWM